MTKPSRNKNKLADESRGSFVPARSNLLQRKCACGGPVNAGGKCEECEKTSLGVQRRASSGRQPLAGSAPRVIGEVLRSPGQTLESNTRAAMEIGLGHDFSQVRVHTDLRADESARAINAEAFTVGNHIVFAAGQYAPDSVNGKRILAHELVHTMQQGAANSSPNLETLAISNPDAHPEREANRLANQVVDWSEGGEKTLTTSNLALGAGLVQRQAPRSTFRPLERGEAPLPRSMSREDFVESMKIRFGVRRIRTGEFDDQAVPGLKQSEWTRWDPGDSSPLYTLIVEAFEDFEERIGSTPPVYDMIFFQTRFDKDLQTGLVKRDASGNVVPDVGASASMAQGELRIYSTVTSHDPVARELLKPGPPTVAESVRENITHELGHGLENVISGLPHVGWAGVNPGLLTDYMSKVGWVGNQLFDLNIPTAQIQKAITEKKSLPANAKQITTLNWSIKSLWKESPVTKYMVEGPAEDFAEAIAFYVEEPGLLKSLSPTRYKFIDEHKKDWLPVLEAHKTVEGRKRIGGGIPDVRTGPPREGWRSSRK